MQYLYLRVHAMPLLGSILCVFAMFIISPSNALSQSSSPTVVVRELLKAMDANDEQRIRAVFSENAGQAYGQGEFKTGDSFWTWLSSDVIRREGRVLNPEISVDGQNVIVTGEFRNNAGYRSAANFLFTVKNGKITSWRIRY